MQFANTIQLEVKLFSAVLSVGGLQCVEVVNKETPHLLTSNDPCMAMLCGRKLGSLVMLPHSTPKLKSAEPRIENACA